MWIYIGNTCNVEREEACFSRDRKCLQYHETRVWNTYIIIVLKGLPLDLFLNVWSMSSRIESVSLVARLIYRYEDSWFSSIVSKREMLNLYGLYVDQINLGWKGVFAPIQMIISIYVHILCIFRRYRREQKIVFKTFKERKRDIIQEGDNLIPPWREWERAVSVRE
jgi:hypothetical protein